MRALRSGLDALYLAGGLIGALFLVLILLMIMAQMLSRWLGFVIPGSTDYAGYFMAASSFFALAYALTHGAHIRVSLLLNAMGAKRRYGEAWCYAIATLLSGYFAWYAWKGVLVSFALKDVSQGQDATLIWIPQLAMGVGVSLLFIAFLDLFVTYLVTGKSLDRSTSLGSGH